MSMCTLYYGTSVWEGRGSYKFDRCITNLCTYVVLRAPPPNKSSVIQCDNEHKTHYQSIFNFLFVLPYIHINDLPPVLIVVSFRFIWTLRILWIFRVGDWTSYVTKLEKLFNLSSENVIGSLKVWFNLAVSTQDKTGKEAT